MGDSNKETNNNSHFCDICSLEYTSKNDLEEHLWSLLHHKKLDKEKGRDYVHKCTLCNEDIFGLLSFTKHIHSDDHLKKLHEWKAHNALSNEQEDAFEANIDSQLRFAQPLWVNNHQLQPRWANNFQHPRGQPYFNQRNFYQRTNFVPIRPRQPPQHLTNWRAPGYYHIQNVATRPVNILPFHMNQFTSSPRITEQRISALPHQVRFANPYPQNGRLSENNMSKSSENHRQPGTDLVSSKDPSSLATSAPTAGGKAVANDVSSKLKDTEVHNESFKGFEATRMMRQKMKALNVKHSLHANNFKKQSNIPETDLNSSARTLTESIRNRPVNNSVEMAIECPGSFEILSRENVGVVDSDKAAKGKHLENQALDDKQDWKKTHECPFVGSNEEQVLADFVAEHLWNKTNSLEGNDARKDSSSGDVSDPIENVGEKTSKELNNGTLKETSLSYTVVVTKSSNAISVDTGMVKKSRESKKAGSDVEKVAQAGRKYVPGNTSRITEKDGETVTRISSSNERRAGVSRNATKASTDQSNAKSQGIAMHRQSHVLQGISGTGHVDTTGTKNTVGSVATEKVAEKSATESHAKPRNRLADKSENLDASATEEEQPSESNASLESSIVSLDESLMSTNLSNQCEFRYQDGRRCPTSAAHKFCSYHEKVVRDVFIFHARATGLQKPQTDLVSPDPPHSSVAPQTEAPRVTATSTSSNDVLIVSKEATVAPRLERERRASVSSDTSSKAGTIATTDSDGDGEHLSLQSRFKYLHKATKNPLSGLDLSRINLPPTVRKLLSKKYGAEKRSDGEDEASTVQAENGKELAKGTSQGAQLNAGSVAKVQVASCVAAVHVSMSNGPTKVAVAGTPVSIFEAIDAVNELDGRNSGQVKASSAVSSTLLPVTNVGRRESPAGSNVTGSFCQVSGTLTGAHPNVSRIGSIVRAVTSQAVNSLQGTSLTLTTQPYDLISRLDMVKTTFTLDKHPTMSNLSVASISLSDKPQVDTSSTVVMASSKKGMDVSVSFASQLQSADMSVSKAVGISNTKSLGASTTRTVGASSTRLVGASTPLPMGNTATEWTGTARTQSMEILTTNGMSQTNVDTTERFATQSMPKTHLLPLNTASHSVANVSFTRTKIDIRPDAKSTSPNRDLKKDSERKAQMQNQVIISEQFSSTTAKTISEVVNISRPTPVNTIKNANPYFADSLPRSKFELGSSSVDSARLLLDDSPTSSAEDARREETELPIESTIPIVNSTSQVNILATNVTSKPLEIQTKQRNLLRIFFDNLQKKKDGHSNKTTDVDTVTFNSATLNRSEDNSSSDHRKAVRMDSSSISNTASKDDSTACKVRGEQQVESSCGYEEIKKSRKKERKSEKKAKEDGKELEGIATTGRFEAGDKENNSKSSAKANRGESKTKKVATEETHTTVSLENEAIAAQETNLEENSSSKHRKEVRMDSSSIANTTSNSLACKVRGEQEAESPLGHEKAKKSRKKEHRSEKNAKEDGKGLEATKKNDAVKRKKTDKVDIKCKRARIDKGEIEEIERYLQLEEKRLEIKDSFLDADEKVKKVRNSIDKLNEKLANWIEKQHLLHTQLKEICREKDEIVSTVENSGRDFETLLAEHGNRTENLKRTPKSLQNGKAKCNAVEKSDKSRKRLPGSVHAPARSLSSNLTLDCSFNSSSKSSNEDAGDERVDNMNSSFCPLNSSKDLFSFESDDETDFMNKSASKLKFKRTYSLQVKKKKKKKREKRETSPIITAVMKNGVLTDVTPVASTHEAPCEKLLTTGSGRRSPRVQLEDISQMLERSNKEKQAMRGSKSFFPYVSPIDKLKEKLNNKQSKEGAKRVVEQRREEATSCEAENENISENAVSSSQENSNSDVRKKHLVQKGAAKVADGGTARQGVEVDEIRELTNVNGNSNVSCVEKELEFRGNGANEGIQNVRSVGGENRTYTSGTSLVRDVTQGKMPEATSGEKHGVMQRAKPGIMTGAVQGTAQDVHQVIPQVARQGATQRTTPGTTQAVNRVVTQVARQGVPQGIVPVTMQAVTRVPHVVQQEVTQGTMTAPTQSANRGVTKIAPQGVTQRTNLGTSQAGNQGTTQTAKQGKSQAAQAKNSKHDTEKHSETVLGSFYKNSSLGIANLNAPKGGNENKGPAVLVKPKVYPITSVFTRKKSKSDRTFTSSQTSDSVAHKRKRSEGTLTPEISPNYTKKPRENLEVTNQFATPHLTSKETYKQLKLLRQNLMNGNQRLNLSQFASVGQEGFDDRVYTPHSLAVTGLQIYKGFMYSCSLDKMIRIHDTKTALCLKSLIQTKRGINCIEIHGRDKRRTLFAGCNDYRLLVFDLYTLQPQGFVSLSGRVLALHIAFGTLYIGLSNGLIAILDMKERKVSGTVKPGEGAFVACVKSTILCHDGKDLKRYLVALIGNVIHILDVQSMLPVKQFPGEQKSNILCIEVFKKRLYAGDGQGIVHLYDLEELRYLKLFCRQVNSGAVTSIKVAGELLVTASMDRLIRCYDVTKGQLMQVYGGHQEIVFSLALETGDQATIYSGGKNGEIRSAKIDLDKFTRCQWENCRLPFGFLSHLKLHILSQHIKPNVDEFRCKWLSCKHMYPKYIRNKDLETDVKHIDEHLQLQNDNVNHKDPSYGVMSNETSINLSIQ